MAVKQNGILVHNHAEATSYLTDDNYAVLESTTNTFLTLYQELRNKLGLIIIGGINTEEPIDCMMKEYKSKDGLRIPVLAYLAPAQYNLFTSYLREKYTQQFVKNSQFKLNANFPIEPMIARGPIGDDKNFRQAVKKHVKRSN